MFETKKKKIKNYLTKIEPGKMTAFDILLKEYIDGVLAEKLKEEGVSGIEIYIDWHDDYKCIDIQGKVIQNYINVQVDPDQFIIGIAEDEVDDYNEYPLNSAEVLYEEIHKNIVGEGDRETGNE